MSFPTWEDYINSYCTQKDPNPYYEEFACRRYNPSAIQETWSCRLVFLKDVLKNPTNKTLRRNGRFIWCKNLEYEGRSTEGLRQISFTVDSGKKRFTVGENNILCVPAKTYVHNNRYFRSKLKTFLPFSSVFSYDKTIKMMARAANQDISVFRETIAEDNPYRPGALVRPRLGYFHPEINPGEIGEVIDKSVTHPIGIILGRAFADDYLGREFYRVRFGATTYEKIHPVQMEIINEV